MKRHFNYVPARKESMKSVSMTSCLNFERTGSTEFLMGLDPNADHAKYILPEALF